MNNGLIYSSVDFLDVDTGFIAGQFSVLKTTDGGLTWTSEQLPASVNSFGSIDMVDENNGFVAGSLGLVLKSSSSNTAPIIDSFTANIDPIQINTEATATLSFTDPDEDTHTVTIDWGDGSIGAIEITDDLRTISPIHTYTTPGIYTVLATITDGTESDSATYEFVVVYDPEGGFVTGGGWIDSLLGAYTEDPTLEGKASFGFVSKYKKGTTIPIGNTEFQFKAVKLNFHSSEYDWLVVSGHQAKFKGTGTINGVGNFGFMLSAVDEKLTPSVDSDLFRIKIWDIDNNDSVVYDNEIGTDDNAEPTTAISAGSIVIHKAK